MSLNKVTYKDKQTVITAKNLNDIQDAIINLEDVITDEMIDAICGASIQKASEVEF